MARGKKPSKASRRRHNYTRLSPPSNHTPSSPSEDTTCTTRVNAALEYLRAVTKDLTTSTMKKISEVLRHIISILADSVAGAGQAFADLLEPGVTSDTTSNQVQIPTTPYQPQSSQNDQPFSSVPQSTSLQHEDSEEGVALEQATVSNEDSDVQDKSQKAKLRNKVKHQRQRDRKAALKKQREEEAAVLEAHRMLAVAEQEDAERKSREASAKKTLHNKTVVNTIDKQEKPTLPKPPKFIGCIREVQVDTSKIAYPAFQHDTANFDSSSQANRVSPHNLENTSIDQPSYPSQVEEVCDDSPVQTPTCSTSSAPEDVPGDSSSPSDTSLPTPEDSLPASPTHIVVHEDHTKEFLQTGLYKQLLQISAKKRPQQEHQTNSEVVEHVYSTSNDSPEPSSEVTEQKSPIQEVLEPISEHSEDSSFSPLDILSIEGEDLQAVSQQIDFAQSIAPYVSENTGTNPTVRLPDIVLTYAITSPEQCSLFQHAQSFEQERFATFVASIPLPDISAQLASAGKASSPTGDTLTSANNEEHGSSSPAPSKNSGANVAKEMVAPRTFPLSLADHTINRPLRLTRLSFRTAIVPSQDGNELDSSSVTHVDASTGAENNEAQTARCHSDNSMEKVAPANFPLSLAKDTVKGSHRLSHVSLGSFTIFPNDWQERNSQSPVSIKSSPNNVNDEVAAPASLSQQDVNEESTSSVIESTPIDPSADSPVEQGHLEHDDGVLSASPPVLSEEEPPTFSSEQVSALNLPSSTGSTRSSDGRLSFQQLRSEEWFDWSGELEDEPDFVHHHVVSDIEALYLARRSAAVSRSALTNDVPSSTTTKTPATTPDLPATSASDTAAVLATTPAPSVVLISSETTNAASSTGAPPASSPVPSITLTPAPSTVPAACTSPALTTNPTLLQVPTASTTSTPSAIAAPSTGSTSFPTPAPSPPAALPRSSTSAKPSTTEANTNSCPSTSSLRRSYKCDFNWEDHVSRRANPETNLVTHYFDSKTEDDYLNRHSCKIRKAEALWAKHDLKVKLDLEEKAKAAAESKKANSQSTTTQSPATSGLSYATIAAQPAPNQAVSDTDNHSTLESKHTPKSVDQEGEDKENEEMGFRQWKRQVKSQSHRPRVNHDQKGGHAPASSSSKSSWRT